MENHIVCPHCKGNAVLKENSMTIQSGLTRIKVPASHYECQNCKRIFSTDEQRKETNSEVSTKRATLVHQDMRKGRLRNS